MTDPTSSQPFRRWIRQPQTLVALAAVVLSLCGLFIAVYEASLVRRAQRASVWPYLEVTSSITPAGVTIWVRNSGVGPARVRTATIRHRGETRTGWTDAIGSLDGDAAGVGAYTSTISGRVLPVTADKEKIFELRAESGEEERAAAALIGRAILDGTLDVVVCYCSVFDECWLSSLQDVVGTARPDEAADGERRVGGCEPADASSI